jgi:hypothetical protein
LGFEEKINMGCTSSARAPPPGPVSLKHFDVQRVIGKGKSRAYNDANRCTNN